MLKRQPSLVTNMESNKAFSEGFKMSYQNDSVKGEDLIQPIWILMTKTESSSSSLILMPMSSSSTGTSSTYKFYGEGEVVGSKPIGCMCNLPIK